MWRQGGRKVILFPHRDSLYGYDTIFVLKQPQSFSSLIHDRDSKRGIHNGGNDKYQAFLSPDIPKSIIVRITTWQSKELDH